MNRTGVVPTSVTLALLVTAVVVAAGALGFVTTWKAITRAVRLPARVLHG